MRRDLPRLRSARSRATRIRRSLTASQTDQIDLRVAQSFVHSHFQPWSARSYTSKFADGFKAAQMPQNIWQIHGSMAMKKRPFSLVERHETGPYRLRHRREMLRTATPDRVLRFIGKSHPATLRFCSKAWSPSRCANSRILSHPAEPPRL